MGRKLLALNLRGVIRLLLFLICNQLKFIYMITMFMITEVTKLVASAQKNGVNFSNDYIDALYELPIEEIVELQKSYNAEKLVSA
jgi:diacylglycerol kinase family enzyme